MKKSLLIISSVLFVFSSQLKAKNEPILKENSPLLVKKKSLFMKDDAPASSPKHVIKLNLTQLALTNISMQYEFAFHKNFSAALGASYLIKREIPSQFFAPSTNGEGYQLPKFGGYSITPEIRFYPGKKVKHKAPHGFYLAPYFRYSKYSFTTLYVDRDSVSGKQNIYNVKAAYSGFTAGLMIGSQWIIGKHFSIDWWILGGGYGKAKFMINSESADGSLNMSPQEQENLKNDIRTNIGELGSFGSGEVTVETTSNSATATVKGLPMTSIRGFGLVLGFAF
ncbi:MAG: DUF3575 domain-containing protein [Burkholderiales bacterium]|nr:DUF3575 domain-containing protein [Bacteroidia bacterium]